jgi:PST family polysaccharide transporter
VNVADLTQTSLRGMRWAALSQLLAQVAMYGSFIVLARILTPAEYGTVALATMAVGFVAILNELGMAAALIQRQDLKPGHLHAAFVSNMAVGLTLAAGMFLAAPAIAAFFKNAEVAPLLQCLALGFPIVALNVVPRALMEKALRFKALGAVEAGAAIANGGLAIGLALSGFGVWSLVYGTLTGYFVQLIAVWAVSGFKPGTRFSGTEFKELFSFGASVLGTRLFSYFNGNVDTMIVGRVLGAAPLGVYSLAYKLVTMPMLKVSHVVLRVAYPAFARMQHDDEALRRNYMRLTSTLALLIFPLLAGMAVLAPELITTVFGPKWLPAAQVTQILCLVGAFKAMVCSIGTIFLCKGRPDIELKLNIYGAIKLPIFLIVGSHWGVTGVATAYLLSSLTGAPVQQHFANRLIGLSWGTYLRGMAVPFAGAATLVAALVIFRFAALAAGAPAWLILAGSVPVALGTYLGALSALKFDWIGLVKQVLGRSSSPSPRPLEAKAS